MTAEVSVPRLRLVWYRSEPILAFGGGERVLIEGLRCFDEMGVEATLLLPEVVSPEFAEFFGPFHSRTKVVPDSDVVTSRHLTWFDRAVRAVRGLKRLRKAVLEIGADIVVANEQKEVRFLWLCSVGGLLRLPPIVTFIHGSPFQFSADATKYAVVFRSAFRDIWTSDPVYRDVIPSNAPVMGVWQRLKLEANCAILKAGVRMARLSFVLSEKNRDEVNKLYGATRVEVVCPGGYTNRDLEANEECKVPTQAADVRKPILLSICRLISKKRVDLIIRAFQMFLDSEPNSTATLVIGGTGPDEHFFRNLVESLGLKERVIFLGFIPDAEILDWYAACDLFLSADNADYDLTVMMSLPKGKKIIVSTQYEIPRELNSLRRFFFQASPNPAAFASKIAQAVATQTDPLTEKDLRELYLMTWEKYFENVVSKCRHEIVQP